MEKGCAIYFMPYLCFYGDQTIDKFHFWNYRNFRKAYVKDQKIRIYLSCLFSHFIDIEKKPISGITVVTQEGTDFLEKWDKETWERCKTVIDCFAFEFIRNRSNGWQNFVAENFILSYQSLDPASKFIFMKHGGYHVSKNAYSDIDKIYIQRPFYIPSHNMMNINDLMNCGFSHSVTEALLKCKDEKILNAVRFFNQSHYNYDLQDDEYRFTNTIFLWTAFEILTQKCFKDVIISLMKKLFSDWFDNKEAKFSGEGEKQELDIDTDNEFLKEFFKWISSFYKLRNKYFHGDKKKPSMFYNEEHSHFMIARAVLAELIEKELEDADEHQRNLSNTSPFQFQFQKYFKNEYDYKYESEKNLDPRQLELAKKFLNSLRQNEK